jgi:6-phospho-3-hexuloisomerase
MGGLVMSEASRTILNEIQEVFKKVDRSNVEKLVDVLSTNQRIFVLGEGRSGLMAKSFAMRLMHLGLHVYVVGETTTPSVQKGDILIAISGSGTTSTIVGMAEKAKNNGVMVVGVTSDQESKLAHASECTIHIPAATKYRKEGELFSEQPLSSLFDQSVHIYFDAVCLSIVRGQKSGNEEAFVRHNNLE